MILKNKLFIKNLRTSPRGMKQLNIFLTNVRIGVLKPLVGIIALVFLYSCGTTKKVVQPEVLPNWVTTKPVISGYYVGVGSAQKSINVNEYQTTSKNRALADMTSEISVNISIQSVLHKFESSAGFSEDYSASIKAKAKEQLEGYELVNTFESQTHYYVYYKLSKDKYKAIKKQRKDDAINKGVDLLQKANGFNKNLKTYDAILNYIKGLEVIKPYFSESLECDVNGKSIYLGNELFSGLTTTINSIVVTPKVTEIDATNGKPILSNQLNFTFKTSTGYPIQGLPVVFTLGSKPLRNSKTETNTSGKVSYEIHQMNSRLGTGYFIAKLDANKIASQCTADPMLRKMLRKMDMPSGQILIRLKNPIFYIETTERNFGKDMNPKVLKRKMEQLLTNNSFPVVFNREKADFIIEVNTNTSKSKKEGRMHYAILTGEVKVIDANGQLILMKPIENVKGVQLNYNDAGFDAYNNLTNYLNRTFLPKLKETLD